jgi:hypothetical protein
MQAVLCDETNVRRLPASPLFKAVAGDAQTKNRSSPKLKYERDFATNFPAARGVDDRAFSGDAGALEEAGAWDEVELRLLERRGTCSSRT